MAEKLYLPGYGSTARGTRTVAMQLSEHFDEDVHGIPLRESLRKPQAFFNGKEVYTMSGGMSALEGSTPESILAIAPPVPQNALVLAKRAKAISAKMGLSADTEAYGDSWREEIAPHMVQSLKLLWRLSGFNSLESAMLHHERGTDVTLAYMSDDGLFTLDKGTVYEQIELAQAAGIRVVSAEGKHNDFTHRPVELLREIAVASSVVFEPKREPFYVLHPGYIPAVA
jgi:hypothetical protein